MRAPETPRVLAIPEGTMAQTEGVFLLHMKSKSSMPCNIESRQRHAVDLTAQKLLQHAVVMVLMALMSSSSLSLACTARFCMPYTMALLRNESESRITRLSSQSWHLVAGVAVTMVCFSPVHVTAHYRHGHGPVSTGHRHQRNASPATQHLGEQPSAPSLPHSSP